MFINHSDSRPEELLIGVSVNGESYECGIKDSRGCHKASWSLKTPTGIVAALEAWDTDPTDTSQIVRASIASDGQPLPAEHKPKRMDLSGLEFLSEEGMRIRDTVVVLQAMDTPESDVRAAVKRLLGLAK